MASVTIRTRGPRRAEEVWERYARPQLWPSWSPQIRRVECTAEWLEAGVTGRVFGPLRLSAGFVVDEWDDVSRRWSWTVRAGIVSIGLAHGVDAVELGCRTWLTVRTALPVLPVALGYLPIARVALHRLVH
jgi:hypothetical protein